MNKNSEVVVVGAGVMGAWSALRAQQSGLSTTLVDAWSPGHLRGTSGADTRILIATSMGDEYYARSAWKSLEGWRQFEQECGEQLFVQAGAITFLGEDSDGFIARRRAVADSAGVPLEVLSQDDIRGRWPQLGVDDVATALFEPASGVLRARRAVQATVREFTRAGGRFVLGSMQPDKSAGGTLHAVVDQSGNRVHGDVFVFACGPWLPRIFPDVLGDHISVTKQDVTFFGSPQGVGDYELGAIPAYIDHLYNFDGVPGLDGHGLKTQPERRGPLWEPTLDDRLPDPGSIQRAKEFVAARFPGLAGQPVAESQVCQGERTADLDWIIDKHPGFDNVWLVGGGSSHGFKHGPEIGHYVLERLRGGGRETEDQRFGLARLALRDPAVAQLTPREIA